MELALCLFAAVGLTASMYGQYLYWRRQHDGLLTTDACVERIASSSPVRPSQDRMTESYGGVRRLRLVGCTGSAAVSVVVSDSFLKPRCEISNPALHSEFTLTQVRPLLRCGPNTAPGQSVLEISRLNALTLADRCRLGR